MAMKLELDVKHPDFKSSKALSKAGLVLKTTTTAGELDTAGANEAAFGIALKKTEDPHNLGTYLVGQKVPVAFHGIVDLQLPATNKAIVVGNMLITAANGLVDKGSIAVGAGSSPTLQEIQKKVAIALEAVASSTGGTVKGLLDIEHIV